MTPTVIPLHGEAALAHAVLVANLAFQAGALGILLLSTTVAPVGQALVEGDPLPALGTAVACLVSWLVLA